MIGEPLVVALVGCGLAVVVRAPALVAIVLVAAQSLALGVAALVDGLGESAALSTAGVALLAKAVVLPALLLWVVRRTREPRLIVAERHALARASRRRRSTLARSRSSRTFGLDAAGAATAPSRCWRSASRSSSCGARRSSRRSGSSSPRTGSTSPRSPRPAGCRR